MPGPGTSKEDKRRKRRSLPYEKKPQADMARLKKKFLQARTGVKDPQAGTITPGGKLTKKDIKVILRPLGKILRPLGRGLSGAAAEGIVRILNKRKKKNPHK